MAFNKDVVMQKVQRFWRCNVYTSIDVWGFGIIVALSILCKNPMILGSIAEKGTAWYNFWYIIEQGAWTVFNQLPLLFVIGLPIGLAKKNNDSCMYGSIFDIYYFQLFCTSNVDFMGSKFWRRFF